MTNKEELKRLAEMAAKDKDFCDKFTAAAKARNIDEVIRLAAEKGVTLSAEDFAFDGKRELDQEELENVAGGGVGDSCKSNLQKFTCVLMGLMESWRL